MLEDGRIGDYSAILNEQSTSQPQNGQEESPPVAFDPSEWMVARVYSVGKGYVRVELPEPVEGIDKGHWR